MGIPSATALFLCLSIRATAATCESLAALVQSHTIITKAELLAEGAAAPQDLTRHPAFCRVAATLRPSTDSDIKVEVWLPASGWNGKYQAVGNGGWSGSIGYRAMAEAI